MHTTRNRLAQSSRKGGKPPSAHGPRNDQIFMLRQGTPAQCFPADLIVPPHRGAVITAAAWPGNGVPAPIDDAAIAHGAPGRSGISRKAAKKAARRAAARERAQALAGRTAQPSSPPDRVSLPAVRIEPECVPALALLPEPEPLVLRPAPVEPAPIQVMPDAPAPLPTARALVPRRQGFVDVLAFMLRDSGRRLSRWSSARRRADEMQEKLAKAEARMRAMEAQLAALQALQQRLRTSSSPLVP
jgi:hypothetical protein